MLFLTCVYVLISAVALHDGKQQGKQTTLDHENIRYNKEEIESIVKLYQQWDEKYQKDSHGAKKLEADLFSASSPFYQSLLEMLPPTPPYAMNAKPMPPRQSSSSSMPSPEQFRFARMHTAAGQGTGFIPTAGGSYPYGGRGFHYVPSQFHHPPPPPLAPPPPPPPPLYGAAGMQDLERLAVEQREAYNDFHKSGPSDFPPPRFKEKGKDSPPPRFKEKDKDNIDIRTAAKTNLPPIHHPEKGEHDPRAPAADMLGRGSLLNQILSHNRQTKASDLMPTPDHQRTMMQHMNPTEQARFAALSEYYKKVKRPAPITKQQTNQPKNINSHAELSDPNLIKSKDALNDPKLTPRLLEVDEKSVLDAQQQSRSLLRENSNTRQGKLRRRHIRGSQ